MRISSVLGERYQNWLQNDQCPRGNIVAKPSFKRPFINQRCVIPVSGFFEWKITPDGKIPYYIKAKNTDMFGLAGLFEIAHDAEDKELKTFTIITTLPNEFMAKIHDRMPVIILKDKLDYWLDNSKYEQEKSLDILVRLGDEMEKWSICRKYDKI